MGQTDSSIKKGAAQKKSRWPAAIIGLLAAVFLVNAGVLYLSVRTDDGLVNEDYYMKGLFYDEGLEGAKKLGWKIDFSFGPAPVEPSGGLTPVRVDIKKGGALVEDARVTLTLKRPATDRFDASYALARGSDGYTGTLEFPAAGLWDVEVRAGKGGLEMTKTFRIRV